LLLDSGKKERGLSAVPSGLTCIAIRQCDASVLYLLLLFSKHLRVPSSRFFEIRLTSIPVSRYELKPLDEMLVLCSDGVIENDSFKSGGTTKVVEAARECVTMYGFDSAPECLCDIAVETNSDDNVTAVFVRFCEVKPKPAPPRSSRIGGAFKKL
jgi:serine/threonine protein phosphatase PrpC